MSSSRSNSKGCRTGPCRRWGRALALLSLFGLACAAAHAAPTGDPPSPYHCWLEKELAQLYEEVSPAIVSVVSYRVRATAGAGEQEGLSPNYTLRRLVASGIVVGPRGSVVTPARVALPGDSIVVTFPSGQRVRARYKGMDPATSIAVLDLESTGSFPFLEPPGEGDPVLPEWVAAVAYGPWGGPNPGWPTVSLAQKASIERMETKYGSSAGEIWQLHAPIMPGNQGGALVSLSGKWVGLIIGVVSGEQEQRSPLDAGGAAGAAPRTPRDEGVIVPAAVVARAIREIESSPRVRPGFLGVQTEAAGGASAAGHTGVVVRDVLPESPADRYGIRPGDFILAFDDQPVDSVGELTRLVQSCAPGRFAKVDIQRRGLRGTLSVCVGDSDSAELFFTMRRVESNERTSLQQMLHRLRRQEQLIERRLRSLDTSSAPSSGS